MKAFSAIRRDREEWVFDYAADTDPSDDLYWAGALVAEDEDDEQAVSPDSKRARYSGAAYADPNSEAALRAIQARLREWGWTLNRDT